MKQFILTAGLLLVMAGTSWATVYTGSITSAAGGGLYATQQWSGGTASNPNASLSWVVDDTSHPGFWTYAYHWTTYDKDLSHIIIEVSKYTDGIAPDSIFTLANINTTATNPATTPGYELDTYSSQTQGGANPMLPGPLYGLRWDGAGKALSLYIVTDQMPMWGNIYARDGVDDVPLAGTFDVYAYNTGFLATTSAVIGNGNAYDQTNGYAWVLVPDPPPGTIPVPEPATVVLLGSGLLGLLYVGRRKRKS